MAIIDGTAGNDDIKANGNHDDVINGFGGDDIIDGGAGNDVINGGTGNDTLSGGGGNFADTFVFGLSSGVDTVTDFQSGLDVIDLSGTGVSDLTGRVTDNAEGYAVIDLGNGNSITLEKISAADFLANPANVVLAPDPHVFLGIDDTYTDAGNFTDQIIDGDSNGEELTDTDTFIFGPGTGNDTITDFQQEDLDLSTFEIIPGDLLDLSAYGIYGNDLTDAGFPAYFDSLVSNNLLESYSVTTTDTVLNFTDGSSLTLLGIGEFEIGTVIEFNMIRDTGGSA